MEISSRSTSNRRTGRDSDRSDGEVDEQPAAVYVDPFAKHREAPAAASANTEHAKSTRSAERPKRRGPPLSVDEALRKRAQTAEPAKPVFLTKAQRAQLALERRQREADEVRRKRAAEVRAFGGAHRGGEDGEQMSEDASESDAQSRSRHSNKGRRSRRSRSRSRSPSPERARRRYHDRDDPRGDRRQPGSRSARSRSPADGRAGQPRRARGGGDFELIGRQSSDGTGDRVLTDRERAAIRQRYLVGSHESAAAGAAQSAAAATAVTTRRSRKQGGRVVFDWDAAEDTSRDISDLYERRAEALQPPPRPRVPARRGLGGGGRLADERHWSQKPLAEMRDRDWRIFREDFSIACKGGAIPNPYRSWAESGIPPEVLRVIDDVGYAEPTPIQRQAIPVGLERRDLIGIAETGSGKTASFLVPMVAHILQRPLMTERRAADGPYALVLAPTRELAQQIEQETQKFARRLGLRSVSIVGGHGIEGQAMALHRGAEIVIATPGRLRDCLERRVLVLNQCDHVVMDEADRMVDMGFEDDVTYILDALPAPMDTDRPPGDGDGDGGMGLRHTTMFSATMPPPVERMARKYLRRPATVTIGTAGQAVDTVEQRVEFIAADEPRRTRLLALLEQHVRRDAKAIVFVNQKKNVELLAAGLRHSRFAVVTLHSGKTQEQREQALARLRSGDADVLVATDVAGRGIDVNDIGLVVNFDMAKDIESYTHRIGRTGRAGRSGLAVTFINPVDDRNVLYDLRKMVAASPLSRCPHELASHEAAQAPPALFKAAARGGQS
ncbi:mRNA splicing protein prp28 [Coemansia erecta]|uniref:RNA helicase n=1 Tax=Coemansia erecta TaxID=147472 RepID=A0A9W7XWT3_9FUNG|nr:mRNA splicing protein prp28 [Coemansia erecta]